MSCEPWGPPARPTHHQDTKDTKYSLGHHKAGAKSLMRFGKSAATASDDPTTHRLIPWWFVGVLGVLVFHSKVPAQAHSQAVDGKPG